MRAGLVAVLVGVTLATGGKVACACSCEPVTPAQAQAEADVVFVGVPTRLEGTPDPGSPEPVTYDFAVQRVIKGHSARQLRVQTSPSEDACGVAFTIGVRYMVYAVGTTDPLFVTLCGGTHRVQDPT